MAVSVRVKIIVLIFILIVMSFVFQLKSNKNQNIVKRINMNTIAYSDNSLDNHSILCYYKNSNSLPSISEFQPLIGKSIFFLETTCNSEKNGKIVITLREACAVESAARQNPNLEVNLIYLSPGIVKNEGTESDHILQVLQSYKNVKLRHLNVDEYITNTPVENLWKKKKIQESNYLVSHISDVLRYLTLWKYGGIYLDLDVIVLKSLENLPLNYAGAESQHTVGSSVLSFEPEGDGHILATMCLNDLQKNFNGKTWANNGPGIITNLAKRECTTNTVSELTGKTCLHNFRVYHRETFFPVEWQNWKMYFNETFLSLIEELTEETYVIHMWNKLSFQKKIKCGEPVPYLVFAQKYCPKVYSQCQDFF